MLVVLKQLRPAIAAALVLIGLLVASSPRRPENLTYHLAGVVQTTGTPPPTGTPPGNPPVLTDHDFTVTGAVVRDAAGSKPLSLFPDARGYLLLTVANRKNQPMSVTSLHVDVARATTKPGCSGDVVQVTDFAGALTVPALGSAAQPLPLRMVPTAPDACKDASFTLTFTGLATKK